MLKYATGLADRIDLLAPNYWHQFAETGPSTVRPSDQTTKAM